MTKRCTLAALAALAVTVTACDGSGPTGSGGDGSGGGGAPAPRVRTVIRPLDNAGQSIVFGANGGSFAVVVKPEPGELDVWFETEPGPPSVRVWVYLVRYPEDDEACKADFYCPQRLASSTDLRATPTAARQSFTYPVAEQRSYSVYVRVQGGPATGRGEIGLTK